MTSGVSEESRSDRFLREASQFFSEGRLSECRCALHQYLCEQPESGRGWELLGLVYHGWRQWSKAQSALEEATIRVPLQCRAQCALADSYLAAGKITWAEEHYVQLIDRPRVQVSSLLGAAAGLKVLSQTSRSVLACRRAIQIDPSHAQAHYDLAYYLRLMGAEVQEIETAARRAVCLAPTHWGYRIGLAGFLHAQQRSTEAAMLLWGLRRDDILHLQCPCCLTNLMEIFEAVEDEIRAGWCRTQREHVADCCGKTKGKVSSCD